MKEQPFLTLVVRSRRILPPDVLDKLLILGNKFTDTERDEINAILTAGLKKQANELTAAIRSVKKIIREMKEAKEEHERMSEQLPTFS